MLILYGVLTVFGSLCALFYKKLPFELRKRTAVRLGSKRIMLDIKRLKPGENAHMSSIEFFDRRICLAAAVVAAGGLLAFAGELKALNTHELLAGNMIERNGFLGEKKRVRLKIREEGSDYDQKLEVTVSEKKYTYEQLMQMSQELGERLTGIVISDNESLDHVVHDMDFPSSVPGYPFRISFLTSDPLLLDSKGRIKSERFKKLGEERDIYDGIPTGIHTSLTYEDFVYELDFAARLYPDDADRELTLSGYAKELIQEADESTRESDYVVLPDNVGGKNVLYEEAAGSESLILLVLMAVAAVLIYFREESRLRKDIKEREKELLRDYPRMVNKFLLFYSAGLTTRGIFAKLCREYRISLDGGGSRQYLYEEMLICEGLMNEGMGELSAYEGFASACGLHKYRHFISLVEQAVGKGRNDLLIQLETEAMDAFTERKNRAKELGEEAGTKLLFPMLMMLFTVLIIVMVPAFLSFRF